MRTHSIAPSRFADAWCRSVSLTLVPWGIQTLFIAPSLIQRYANGYVFICFGGKADNINNITILQLMGIYQMFNRKSNGKIHEHLTLR